MPLVPLAVIARRRALFALMLALFVTQAGCSSPMLDFPVKTVKDELLESDVKLWLKVVSQLPDKRLPSIPDAWPQMPKWAPTRTLPVRDLVEEERQALAKKFTNEWLQERLKTVPKLARVLRREGLTLEQFAGLTLCLGTAVSRNAIPATTFTDDLFRTSKYASKALETDVRVYATLPDDVAFELCEEAGWLHIFEEAKRLRAAPDWNREIVKQFEKELAETLPPEFLKDSLTQFRKDLETQGKPFDESPQSGRDGRLTWSPETNQVFERGGP